MKIGFDNSYKIILIAILGLGLFYCCTDVDIIVPTEDEVSNLNGQSSDTSSVKFHLDKGNIGLSIDTREIYRKGYFPKKATISFQEYSKFNTTIDIDKYSNLARFSLSVGDLTEEENLAFNSGVKIEVVVEDEGIELSSFQGTQILDSSNRIVNLKTDKKTIFPPISIGEGKPYLIVVYGGGSYLRKGEELRTPPYRKGCNDLDDIRWNYVDGRERSSADIAFNNDPWTEIDLTRFYFYHVEGNKYKIRFGEAVAIAENQIFTGGWMGVARACDRFYSDEQKEARFIINSVDESYAEVFEIIQDDDGWSKLRLASTDPKFSDITNEFIRIDDAISTFTNRFMIDPNPGNVPAFKFRILSAVNWEIQNLGTEYQAPINGPAKLDFAFRSVLKNCSSGVLTEEVGRTIEKTSITSFSSSESLELFSSSEESVTISGSIEAGGKVGLPIVAEGEVKITAGFSFEAKQSRSQTYGQERVWTDSDEYKVSVSRIRTLEMKPFTAVEVYDAIKSIDNVIIPFTIKTRLSGKFSDGTSLSGLEISLQLRSNNFSGIVVEVGDNYVVATSRGTAFMDSLFEASSGAYEIPDGCSL